jgi:ankyrin repeat protein
MGGEMKLDLGRDLYEACKQDNLVRVREVLAASLPSCVEWLGPGRWTPLHAACEVGSIELVKCLLAAGADVNAKFGGGDPPIQVAIHSMFDGRENPSARYDTGFEIVKLLLEAGSDPDIQGGNLCTAEGLALLYRDAQLRGLLVEPEQREP